MHIEIVRSSGGQARARATRPGLKTDPVTGLLVADAAANPLIQTTDDAHPNVSRDAGEASKLANVMPLSGERVQVAGPRHQVQLLHAGRGAHNVSVGGAHVLQEQFAVLHVRCGIARGVS